MFFRSSACWPVGFVTLASKNGEAVRIVEGWKSEEAGDGSDLTGSRAGQFWLTIAVVSCGIASEGTGLGADLWDLESRLPGRLGQMRSR
jgi:hypothetical protein